MDGLAGIVAATNFTPLDWCIVVAYPLIAVVLGFIASRYIADMDDFVVAGRGLRTALGIATLTGTELGLVTVMYSAQKGFTGGFAAFHIGLAAGIVTLFVGLTGFIICGLRRQEVLTIPEFYGKRFGRRTRILGAAILSFAGILNMGMFLKASAMFVAGVTGFAANSTAVILVMLVLLAFVLLYTMLGGMVSVVMSDYVQFVVLSFGLLFATGLAIVKLGWSNIFESMMELKGEAGFNPLIAESTFGVDYVIWMLFLGLASCALWPTSVARALASESERVVKRQFTFASCSYAIRNIVPYFWGICAFVFIMKTPALKEAFFPASPADSSGVASAQAMDSLYGLPVFFGMLLPMGIIGLVTAAMIAAFMSTHDSYLLCWSSVISHDIITPLAGGELSQRTRVMVTRVLILLIGAANFGVSFFFPLLEDLWDYMAVTGGIYFSGALALLVGGLYWRRASSTGAVLALFAGCSAVFGLKAVQQALFGRLLHVPASWLDQLTSQRVGIASIVLTLLFLVAGSLLFPDKKLEKEGKIP